MAVAYDVPIPGYDTFNTINLRLWSSKPHNVRLVNIILFVLAFKSSHCIQEFDLQHFNQGDYFKAIENKQRSETITSVLYPNDNTSEGQFFSYLTRICLTILGKELRLKQQYFFVCATLHDILRRFRRSGKTFTEVHVLGIIHIAVLIAFSASVDGEYPAQRYAPDTRYCRAHAHPRRQRGLALVRCHIFSCL